MLVRTQVPTTGADGTLPAQAQLTAIDLAEATHDDLMRLSVTNPEELVGATQNPGRLTAGFDVQFAR